MNALDKDILLSALMRIKYKAVSLADAQVIALEAIAASKPEPQAQATNKHTEHSEPKKLQANMTPEVLRLLDEVIPFRLRLLRNGSLISLSVLHNCLNEIAQEFGAPDGAMCRTAIAPDDALLAADKAGGEVALTASQQRMLHDFPLLQQFHTKHALGPMLPPSCLCCGQQTHPLSRPVAVKHMELPEIVICKACKDATMLTADKAGDVVVTKNQSGQIVAVTRQDSEGRILQVIAESEVGNAGGNDIPTREDILRAKHITETARGGLPANPRGENGLATVEWLETFASNVLKELRKSAQTRAARKVQETDRQEFVPSSKLTDHNKFTDNV